MKRLQIVGHLRAIVRGLEAIPAFHPPRLDELQQTYYVRLFSLVLIQIPNKDLSHGRFDST